MATFTELISKNSQLQPPEIEHLSELVAEWRLLADLSFADLLLWLPIRKDDKSWPTGYVAIAQIRPTTTATVFNNDLIGSEISWGVNDRVDQALSSGEILRLIKPVKMDELMIKEDSMPVHFAGKAIAINLPHRNRELIRPR